MGKNFVVYGFRAKSLTLVRVGVGVVWMLTGINGKAHNVGTFMIGLGSCYVYISLYIYMYIQTNRNDKGILFATIQTAASPTWSLWPLHYPKL